MALKLSISRDAKEWIGLAAVALVVMGLLAWKTETDGQIQWTYLTGVLITILIYAIFSLGLSMSFGSTGLLNFGHVGFMLLGAYAYGILTMPRLGRPDHAAPFVGALADHSDLFAGVGAWGFLLVLLLSLLGGAAVTFPALLISRRILRRWPRVALLVGVAAGALAAIALFAAQFPLTSAGADHASAALAILIGVLLACAGGLLLGLPTLRLRKDYLGIVTIGAAEILRSVALNEPTWTRGSLNIIGFPRPLNEWALDNAWWNGIAKQANVPPVPLLLAAVLVGVTAYVYLVLETLSRSPWGRVIRAVREDEDAASALGKNVFWYKLQSLMLSAAIAAVAGVLLVMYLAIVAPELFLPIVTFYAFMIVILGGITTHKGAIAGSFLLWGVFSYVQADKQLAALGIGAGPGQIVVVGLAFVLVMMFRPQGILGGKEEMLYAK